ncbi:multicopy suppressor of BFA (Brefeldin A) [Diaporthe eres]|uniref:Multicopy suppressor of BFA (Brefeldin A) n=1 Tax=Diaporthe eres TaxID=83184 RepID=A0ABR1NPL2_DIAER
MADTAAAPAPAPARPTKPDEALFKENLAQAEKEHEKVMAQLNAIRQKIDLASPNKNPENPTTKRRIELQDQLKEIRSKQGAGKNSRSGKQDELKRLEAQVKSKEKAQDVEIGKPFENICAARGIEHKSLKGKLGDKIKEVLQTVQTSYDTQTLRLVEERTAVSHMNSLNGLIRAINKSQEQIDGLQVKIKEIKDSMNDPEAKELSEKYTKAQTELDAIKAEQNEASKSLDTLYAERNKLQKQQNGTYEAKKKLKDEYHQQRKAFQKYEYEQKQKSWERRKAEQERFDKEKKLERAQKMLAEASDPAYLDEIRRANSLLQYYDPSFVAEKAPLQPSTNLQAQAERKVDGSDLKGVKVLSKKDRDEDLFPAQKKGKKGKKHNAAATKSTFNCPPSVLEDCSYMGIDPPMSAEEVPGVVEKVKAKLDHWKADQAAQTQKNIDKAKKEIEKIEAEEAKEKGGKKSSSGTATPNGNGAASNGETSDDKVEEVTKEVQEASIEDKPEEVAAAA